MVQYAVLVVLVGLAISLANWSQILDAFFRPDLTWTTIEQGLPKAFYYTVTYTAGAFIYGLVVGTILALMKLSSVGPYRWLATAYIEFFRGLPAIIVFIAFSLLPLGIPGFRIPFPPYGTVWLALGIVGSAYIAETIRAGIQAVPRGQIEAARSLGMTAGQTMRKIALPQAFRIVLPPLTNELILLTKDSSLIFVIGITVEEFDLTYYGREIANNEANMTPLVVAGFAYLLITLPLSIIVRRMERSGAKAR
ncbi:MAG: ABC transporter permease subunit [Propionibacteriales bacterium]|nr:ABC transporter permease subunit [Propionibacteriales bacterium]